MLQMINHGVITGALFLCIGMIYERTHSRMIEDYGGTLKVRSSLYSVFYNFYVGGDRPAGNERFCWGIPDH